MAKLIPSTTIETLSPTESPFEITSVSPEVDSSCEVIQNFQIAIFFASFATIVALSFLQRRKYLWLNKLKGRPGIIYPVNVLDDRKYRYSYAAAFGLAAGSVASFFIQSLFIGNPFSGLGPIGKVLVLILIVLIYGILYYPVFVCITMESIVSYVIGTIYSWIFLSYQILQLFLCTGGFPVWMTFLLLMPVILCAVFLSVRFPVFLVKLLLEYRDTGQLQINFVERMSKTYQAKYVKTLLYGHNTLKNERQNEKVPENERELSICERWQSRFKTIFNKIYVPRPGFRYSTRLLSTMVIAFIVIYELFLFTLFMANQIDKMEIPGIEGTRYWIHLTIIMLQLSAALTFAFSIVGMLLIMQNYRENMLAVYRGDHSLIPSVAEGGKLAITPATRVVSASRYIGFQAAYMAWGYFIQFFVLWIGLEIVALSFGTPVGRQLLLAILESFGPVIAVGLVVTLGQYLMARFAFLQDRGKSFALNNRRLFHNFTYFMFFYNVFLGMYSCLMRILKSVVIGAFMLSRIDQSTLPRKYERFDPGFRAYVGFLQLENAHTHPILVTFCNLLLQSTNTNTPTSGRDSMTREEFVVNMEIGDGDTAPSSKRIMTEARRRQMIRNRWRVALTLVRNPGLQFRRSHAISRRPSLAENIDIVIDDIITAAVAPAVASFSNFRSISGVL
ncbi:stimulated by retinoic acid gene 6 protein-like isoform X1 [Glandiceps talaboti]